MLRHEVCSIWHSLMAPRDISRLFPCMYCTVSTSIEWKDCALGGDDSVLSCKMTLTSPLVTEKGDFADKVAPREGLAHWSMKALKWVMIVVHL